MGIKILRVVIVIVLIILPFSTILSNFSPYWTDHSFIDFLIASFIFALVSLLLGLFIARGNLFRNDGLLLFLLGIFIAPPFMLGTPETSPLLLERATEEHFRYGMLLLATLILAAEFIIFLRKYWRGFNTFNKGVTLLFIISVALLLWDNYSSYGFSGAMAEWVKQGKKAEDFFTAYNFHELLRTLGRSLLYVLTPWLAFILFKDNRIKKWVVITLSVFGFIGAVFFFLVNFVDQQFYFPFMIPAIAMAPAYWLGLAIISAKHKK